MAKTAEEWRDAYFEQQALRTEAEGALSAQVRSLESKLADMEVRAANAEAAAEEAARAFSEGVSDSIPRPAGISDVAWGALQIMAFNHKIYIDRDDGTIIPMKALNAVIAQQGECVGLLAEALRFYATHKNWNPVADYADRYWYIAGRPWMRAVAALKDNGIEVDFNGPSVIDDALDMDDATEGLVRAAEYAREREEYAGGRFAAGMEAAARLCDEEANSAKAILAEWSGQRGIERVEAIRDAASGLARTLRHFASDAEWLHEQTGSAQAGAMARAESTAAPTNSPLPARKEPKPYGWYSPAEDQLLLNEPDVAWKAKNRIREGYEMIPLYRRDENAVRDECPHQVLSTGGPLGTNHCAACGKVMPFPASPSHGGESK